MKYTKELLITLVIILGVALFYGNTLQNGFIHDDHGQVVDNTYIQSFQYLPKIITGCIWESAVGNCKETYYYRPTQTLSYMLTYQISSQPWIFHLLNLTYYAAIICLIFVLVKLLTKNTFISFLSALIFLIHPLNSEVVNWVATVPELLYTISVLSATIFYLLYRQKNDPKFLKFVYLFFGLGIFSKEPAVFLPFIFVVLDLSFFKQSIKSLLTWKNIKPYIVFIALFLIYMILRSWVLGGLGQDPSIKRTILQQIWIFFDLFGSYVKKLVWPLPLNLFYTFNPSYKILDLNFLINLFITLGFFGACYITWKKHLSLIFFALIWFLIFLLPSLIFVQSIGENLFAERHVFASTIGFSILMAVFLKTLWENEYIRLKSRSIFLSVSGKEFFLTDKQKNWQKGVCGFIGIIILLSLVTAYSRNMLWKTDEPIYIDTLSKSPDADLIRYNLAYLYETGGKTDQAKEQYGTIVKRGTWAGLYKVYNSLGNISRLEKKYDEATNYYQQSVKNNPMHKNAYNNLGALALEMGDPLGSVANLCRAMMIDPQFEKSTTNFNIAASAIQGMDNKAFTALYDQLLKGNNFKPARDASQNDAGGPAPKDYQITFKNKDCSYKEGCLLLFSSNLPKNQFLFPFLTVGKTDSGEIVRTRAFDFNLQTSEVILGIDRQFEDSKIHFWFPDCNGTYYEAEKN